MSERYRWVRTPEEIAARQQMADAYRQMRKENPAMARLVWRRTMSAKSAFTEAFFSSSPTAACGLSLLVKS